ncbi:MAG: NADH-quinone oxidoreductase subunit L [Anaerolineaceae bacterium]|nr:NADH-quinone oxidoreductase subunit L [Anaerolineaceae bacterium]
MRNAQSILLLFVILFPWFGAIIIVAFRQTQEKAQHWLASAFSLLTALAAWLLLPYNNTRIISIPLGGIFGKIEFVSDGLAILLVIIATSIGSLAILFSTSYMKGESQLSRYYSLILLFIGSMTGLVLSSNIFYLFVFWEMTAFCSYALISFYNDDPKAVRGGMKAFIITQLGGIGLLIGIMMIYADINTLSIPVILESASTLPTLTLQIAGFGFLVAAAAKSAQVPLHTWLPDAMEAPTPISALIHAATMVNAGVYLVVRFYPAFETVPGWNMTIIIIACLTSLLAAVMASVAFDLKRVLAYSTISQLGYMVYAIGVGGLFSSQFHLLSHAIFKALLFLSAGAIIHSLGTRDMRLMGGLSKKIPFIRNVFIIGSLSLSGIPFLSGFWSKESVLEHGLEHGPLWAYAIMLITAGLTAYYTIRCVWMVFFGESRSHMQPHKISPMMRTALTPLALGSLTAWLLASPFSKFMQSSMPFHHFHTYSFWEPFLSVLTNPYTYLALGVIIVAIYGFFRVKKMKGLIHEVRGIIGFAEKGLGFDQLNKVFVTPILWLAEGLRYTQTGILNWNIFGILLGLLFLISAVLLGEI